MTYHQLRTFLAVVRAGNLSKAARALNASQPTVSLQLRALQRSLGAALIERPDNGFRLTPAGEKLRRYAEETLGGLQALHQEIAALNGTLSGPLAVGLTFILSGHVLPPALARFRARFPAVDLKVHVDLPEALFAGLLGNTVDVACYLRVRTPPPLTVEPVGSEEFVLIAAPEHPLAGRRLVTPEELSEHPFVALTSMPLRELLESKLRAAGVTPRTVVETRNHDAVMELVQRNVGYSMQIRPLVAAELAAGRLVVLDLTGPPILGDIAVAIAPRQGASPLVQGFVQFLRAELSADRPDSEPADPVRPAPRPGAAGLSSRRPSRS